MKNSCPRLDTGGNCSIIMSFLSHDNSDSDSSSFPEDTRRREAQGQSWSAPTITATGLSDVTTEPDKSVLSPRICRTSLESRTAAIDSPDENIALLKLTVLLLSAGVRRNFTDTELSFPEAETKMKQFISTQSVTTTYRVDSCSVDNVHCC